MMSSRPQALIAAAIIRLTSSSRLMSASTPTASPPAAWVRFMVPPTLRGSSPGVRPLTTIATPSAASASDAAWPMHLLLPVTTATWPRRSSISGPAPWSEADGPHDLGHGGQVIHFEDVVDGAVELIGRQDPAGQVFE